MQCGNLQEAKAKLRADEREQQRQRMLATLGQQARNARTNTDACKAGSRHLTLGCDPDHHAVGLPFSLCLHVLAFLDQQASKSRTANDGPKRRHLMGDLISLGQRKAVCDSNAFLSSGVSGAPVPAVVLHLCPPANQAEMLQNLTA